MSTLAMAHPTDALSILPQTREQSRALAHAELTRFVELVESLDADDWDKPTVCTRWSVRDIVAHQASHVQMGSGLRGFLGQLSPSLLWPYLRRGDSGLDALNQAQVDKRRSLDIRAVIAELRDGMPRSIEARQHMSRLARQVRIPVHPVGLMTLGELFDVIFPRDMWMHRHDIAAATGKPFVQTAAHDGVMVEKTVLDAARYVSRRLPDTQVTLTLRGVSGGVWRFGAGAAVSLAMDALDFMRRTSERLSVDDALPLTESDASPEQTRKLLTVLLAPY